MKYIRSAITTLLLLLFITPLFPQQYLVLEKTGTVKNFKYKTGDKISIGLKESGFVLSGTISNIMDSAFVLDTYTEIKFREIRYVYRPQGFFRTLSGFFLTGGIAYFLISGVNRTFNNEYPVVEKSMLIVGGTMVGAGIALKPFKTRKFDLTQKWRLKTLDFEKLIYN
nr:hypothetical protein [Bacteroidota bacterium]